MVDQGRERRGLARAGRAGDEDEPLGPVAEGKDALRQTELFRRADLERDRAEHGSRPVAVAEEVRAKPRDAGDRVREIGVIAALELFPVARGRHLVEPVEERARFQGLVSRKSPHVAVDPHVGRRTRREMEVRGSHLQHLEEELLDGVIRVHSRVSVRDRGLDRHGRRRRGERRGGLRLDRHAPDVGISLHTDRHVGAPCVVEEVRRPPGIDLQAGRQDLFHQGDERRVRRRLRRVALSGRKGELDLLAARQERGQRSELRQRLQQLLDLGHVCVSPRGRSSGARGDLDDAQHERPVDQVESLLRPEPEEPSRLV